MNSTTQNEVVNALTSAMQTIAQSNVQAKEATLVVEAEVTDVVDEGLGTYKVKYLGNVFEATTAHTEIIYSVGDMVYVIIPNGNFDRNKVILSPVTPTTAVYASTKGGSSYVSLGDNLFKSVADVSLSTYKPHEPRAITVDTTGFSALIQSALQDSRTFNFTCKIKTNIDKSRRSGGNYGIILNIPVIQTIDGIDTFKYYTIKIDTTNIIGDPFNLSVPALQNFYFTLPEDLKYDNSIIPTISSFVEGFMGADDTKPDDIFITDIKLLSTLEISEETMSGYHAIITASEGTSFLASRTSDSKNLTVTAYLNGKVTQLSKFACYWFKENVSISTNSDKFQKFGGIGWEILNKVSQKNINEDGTSNYEYVTNIYTQTVLQDELHCDTRFKCVLVKGDDIISSIVTIKNLASTAKLELSSTSGSTVYPIGVGNVELQLTYSELGITDIPQPNFIINYAWQRLDKKGNNIDNDFYNIEEYNTKVDNTFITKISYPVSEIDEANTIGCTVYLDTPNADGSAVKRQTIGTVWLTVTTGESAGGRLVLTNGDKLYKYDADGDSPMVADYDGPLSSAITAIDPISIAVFKENGIELTSDEYKVTTITWLVPVNSMFVLSSAQKSDTTSNPGYYTISGKYINGYSTLFYNIAKSYNKRKLDNTIIVKATAPSSVLKEVVSNVANIRFLKDGESGTNGSKYSAIITYGDYAYGEKDGNGNIHKLQLIYAADNSTWYLYNPAQPGTYSVFNSAQLRAALYADGEKYSSAAVATWKIFDAERSYAIDAIVSPITVNNNGTISLNGNKWTSVNQNFCATIEARVAATRTSTVASQTNSEEYVYSYYPIECSYVSKADYLVSCLPTMEGGFSKVLYASDGTNPQYDNSEDFYISDKAYDEEIGDLYNFTWSSSSNLTYRQPSGQNCKITPTSKYDNGVAKNFVRAQMSRNELQTSAIRDKRDALNNQLTDKNNQKSYYQMLQNNLDIFADFDYNFYINTLTEANNFYIAKTNIVEVTEKLKKQCVQVKNLCASYLYNEAGLIDSKVKLVNDEVDNILIKLNELADLVYQLGINSNIITKIGQITPSSVSIVNKINYIEIPERNCYFSINDTIDIYNNIVNSIYSLYYNNLVNSTEIARLDIVVQDVVNEIKDFVNDEKLDNLTKTYNTYNEEAYRYTALISTMKSRLKSAEEQLNTYSYSLIIENVIKPIYENLVWYIDFYYGGGYSTKISSIDKEIDSLINKINILDSMLIPGNNVYIIHIKPIIMLYNRYEMSNINGWDGNKLETGDGYILAPQVGAGKKNDANQFTGVVMGVKQVSEKSTVNQQIGLFGYSSGVQSIFLNAEDGSATFGVSGKGQVIIQPSANKAIIKSGNYSTTAKTGMQIDLTTPEIRFGSGNFVVDANGHITAKGGGTIAGWNITDSQLYSNVPVSSGRLVMDSSSEGKIYSGSHDSLKSTSKGFYLSEDGLSISNTIRITATDNGKVEVGRISSSYHWTIDGNSSKSYIGYNASSFNTNTNSVYIGTDGISLSKDKFAVTNAGVMLAKAGLIGGWTITDTTLAAGNIVLNSNGSMVGGDPYSWAIGTDGTAVFNNIVANVGGYIAGWAINPTALVGGNISLNAEGSIVGPTWSINKTGVGVFSNIIITGNGATPMSSSGSSMSWGDNFKVDTVGNLTCKNSNVTGKIYTSEGTIGGWTINAIGLTASNDVYIYSNGNARFANIMINGDAQITGYLKLDDLDRSTFGGKGWTDAIKDAINYNDLATKDYVDDEIDDVKDWANDRFQKKGSSSNSGT